MMKLRSLPIASQISLSMAFVVSLAILLTGSILIYMGFEAQLAELFYAQSQQSQAIALQINNYVDDIQRKLNYLARIQGLSAMDSQTQNSLLNALIRQNGAYELLALLDSDGNPVTVISPGGLTLSGNQAQNPAFLYAFNNQEDYIGEIEFDSELNAPLATLAVPIRNWDNAVDGILLARVNLRFLWAVLEQVRVGESGYAYVIDRRRFLLAQEGERIENFALRDISALPYVDDLLEGRINLQSAYKGLYGIEVFGANASIASADWNLIIELPTAEIYNPVYFRVSLMLVSLGISLMAAMGLSLGLSRQITRPLQILTHVTQEMQAGHFDTRAQLQQHNELGVLAQAFNSMSEQLVKTLANSRANEARYLALLEAMPDLIFRNGADGVFLDYHANQDADLLVAPTEIIGRKSTEILPPEIAEQHLLGIEIVLKTGKEYIYEYDLSLHGQLRHYEARMVASGENEVLTIVRDVTERKQMEAEHLNLLLEKGRIEILGSFINQASHEFKTPISIIRTGLYLLKKSHEPEKQQQQTEKIERQIEAITELVNSLTLMAQLDSGVHREDLTQFNINKIIEVICIAQQAAIDEKHLRLELHLSRQPIFFWGEVDFLKAAVERIVENAIVFNVEGGSIKLSSWQEGEEAVIEVKDTGIGIAPEHLPHIFERFYQVDKTGTRRGFGLGLAIAKAVADYYHGRIEVESTLGQGSAFRLVVKMRFSENAKQAVAANQLAETGLGT